MALRLDNKPVSDWALKFVLLAVLLTLFAVAVYFYWRNNFAPTIGSASSEHAAWMIGIASVVVGMAGAWVAIMIAQIATNAQIKSTQLDNPYFQKSISLIDSANHVTSILELLMSGIERTRVMSYAERGINLRPLQLACSSVEAGLNEQLIDSGLFSYLLRVEQSIGRNNLLPAIVQNFTFSIKKMGEVNVGDSEEHKRSVLQSYIVSLAGMEVVAGYLENMPNTIVLTKQLEETIFNKDGSGGAGVKVSSRMREEIRAAVGDYISKISELGLMCVSYSDAVSDLADRFALALLCELSKTNAVNSGSDSEDEMLEINKRLAIRIKKYCVDKKLLVSEDEKILPTVFVDVDINCSNDVVRTAVEQLSLALFNKINVAYINRIDDCLSYVSKEDKESVRVWISDVNKANSSINVDEPGGYFVDEESVRTKLLLIASKLLTAESCLYVVVIDRDSDFASKLNLAKQIPLSIVHWKGYPYLPNPGVSLKALIEDNMIRLVNGNSSVGEVNVRPPFVITGGVSLEIQSKDEKSKNEGGIINKNAQELRSMSPPYAVIPDEMFSAK